MSDISREEINAKLEATEARVETKFAIVDAKLDRIIQTSEGTKEDVKEAKKAAERARDAVTSTTWNLIFVALGTIGVVIAIYAFGSQLLELAATILQTKAL